MIEVEDLTVRYGDTLAVDGLSLTIERGAQFGLLGPNGAGKTSTISVLAGLVSPTSGRVRVAGLDVTREPRRVKALIGLVPQSLALYSELSLIHNLRIFGGLMGLRAAKLSDRIEWAIDLSQLRDRRHDRVSTLSGGMKRRLNLAASLLHEPELIICDEPTAGVDPQSRNHIFDTLRALQSAGATVVYTTHYMEEVEALCDRVAIMDHGKVIAMGTLAELLESSEPSRMQLELDQPQSAQAIHAALAAAGIDVVDLQPERRTLEAVFLDLTGRQLREDP